MTVYKKSADIEYVYAGDETIILIQKTGEFFQLNRTGTVIFRLVNGRDSVECLLRKSCRLLNVKESTLKKDLEPFLDRLCRMNVIINFVS